jgi:hypothetical protein
MTQAQFAKLLKTAAVTVGLYETTRPPDSGLLRKLEGIARREAERCQESDPAKFVKLKNIEQKFRILRIGETWNSLGPDFKNGLTLFRETDEEPACGYVFLKLETFQEIQSMRTLMELLRIALDARNRAVHAQNRDAAVKAIEELNNAFQKIAPEEYLANLMDARIKSSPLRLTITNEPEGTTTK